MTRRWNRSARRVIGEIRGLAVTFNFFGSGSFKDEYMEAFSNQTKSSDTPLALPFDARLVALSYANTDGDTSSDIIIMKNGYDINNDDIYTWEVRNKFTAWKNDLSGLEIDGDAGDAIACYARDAGNQEPKDLEIIMIWQIIGDNIGEGGERNRF